MENKCVVCGVMFKHKDKRTQVCSPECRDVREKRWRFAYAQKRKPDRSAKINAPRKCICCGAKFPDKTGLGTVKLCSDKCRQEHHKLMCRKNTRDAQRRMAKTVYKLDKFCSICGVDFFDDSPAHNRVRCHKCTANDSQRPDYVRDKICIVCGSDFRDKSRSNGKTMCSIACKEKRRKHLEMLKREAQRPDSVKCRWCGKLILGKAYGEKEDLCSKRCDEQEKRVNYEAHVEKHKDFVFHKSNTACTLDVETFGLYGIPTM